jgi:peptide/nickel transport system substrate-binding protein
MKKNFGLVLCAVLVASLALSGVGVTRAQAVTFILGRLGDTVALDGSTITDGESFRVLNQGCEGLFGFDKDTTNAAPVLAESYEASADGKTWTFKLRKGVKFHDGTPFNAEAVKFNFDRWRFTTDPNHFKDKVFEYYEAMWGGFDDKSIITDVKVVDENTVTMTLSQALGPMLQNLSMSMFAIDSPTAIKEHGPDYGSPTVGYVCTGPYKFVKWEKDNIIELERFADYWGKVEGNVEKIVFRVIKDNAARFAALQKGEITGMEQANKEDVATAQKDKSLLVVERPANNVFYLAFNYQIKEFNDLKVRQAISMAIDREAIVKAFYAFGEAANNSQPPSLWGHNPNVKAPKFDPAGAKKLLADAGFPNGISEVTFADGTKGPLPLYFMPVTRPYNPDGEGIAQAQAKYLADIGVKVELKSAGDWAAYLDARANGKLVGLYQLGWTGDNGDPDNFVCYFFCLYGKENLPREGFYANKELSAVLEKAAALTDKAERTKLYQQAEEMIAKNVDRIYIAHSRVPLIFRAEVKGFIPNPTGSELFRYITIQK